MKTLTIVIFVYLAFIGCLNADTLITSDILNSTTWTLAGSPYIITGNYGVVGNSVPVLTIEAGVTVKFNAGTSLRIGHPSSSNYGGAIISNGTLADPVIFTANSLAPTPGFWNYLRSDANTYVTSTFNYTVFEYGGSSTGMIDVNGSYPQFNNCTFRYSANYGIYHTSTTASANVQNSAFNSNGSYPMHWNAHQASRIGAGNSFSGNAFERILLREVTIATSQTWQSQSIPFEAENNITVNGNSAPILQLQSGTHILFRTGKFLYVGNAGTSASGGGLNADGAIFGALDPATGWNGLYFMPFTSGSTLANCTIRDVSSSPFGSIYIQTTNNTVTIQGCLFTQNNNYGIYAQDNALFSVSGSTFQQCVKTVSLAAREVARLGNGNQYLSNTDNRVHCRGGQIPNTQSWSNQNTPIYVINSMSLYSTSVPVLNIPYGSVLEFASGIGFSIGYTASAAYGAILNATGVTFRGEVNTAGYWKGLDFQRFGGNSVLSGCTITDAGYGNVAAVTFNYPNGTMTGCLVQNCLAVGVRFASNIVLVSLSGNTITQCGSYPLSVPANCVRSLGSGNDFGGNTLDMVEVRAETVDTSGIWGNPGVPYYINGSMSIYDGSLPHIKIEFGTVVMLANAAVLNVGYAGAPTLMGSLEAKGVTFTRRSATETPHGLVFQPYLVSEECVFTGCTFEYMRHSSYDSAVYVSGSAPIFQSCTFSNNPGIGIKGNATARFTVSNCSFINNGGYPISTSAAAFDVVSGTGNYFSGNNPNRILISGGILDQSYTWNNPSVPVEVTADVSVYSGSSPILTLNSGLTLLFRANTGLFVGYSGGSVYDGGIHADGATFTALSGTIGGWRGITIHPYLTGGSYIRNCIIEYGASNGNIYVNGVAFPSIESCVIRYGEKGIKFSGVNATSTVIRNHFLYNEVGVYCDSNANPLIGGSLGDGNAIFGNTSYGVQNTTTSVTVNAEYNWWGDESGPYHANTNPAGLGDDVSSYVDFDPWRTSNIGDAPSRFHLLTPANYAILQTLTPVIDWEDAIDPTPGDIITYTLELALNSGFTTGFIGISGLPSSVYHTPNGLLSDNQRYYWRVKATDSQGQTTWSFENYFYFDTAVPEAPLPFDLISPVYNEVVDFTSNLLTWEQTTDPDIGDVVSYTVYMDETAGFETPEIYSTSATSLYSGYCAPGTLYYWKVKATDLTDRSTFSPTWRFFVASNARPRAPQMLALIIQGGDILLTWESIPGADSYDVYFAQLPTDTYTLLQNVGSTQYLHLNAANERIGFYMVVAQDNY